jgi:hypothetical protein
MFKRSFFVVLFLSALLSASVAYAFAPALIWIGRTLATVAVESIVVEGVTRGFAANDPYVKNRVSVPSKNIPAAFRKTKGWLNPYWAAFAIAAGLIFDEQEGFKIKNNTASQAVMYPGESVAVPGPATAGYYFSRHTPAVADYTKVVSTSMGIDGGAGWKAFPPYGDSTAQQLRFSAVLADSRGVTMVYTSFGFLSDQNLVPASGYKPISDPAVAAMALAYLASDNRPADAFMDVAGNPIPELLENAVLEPVPNVDTDTLTDLADYRAGVLQTTDPNAEHYVTPERYEELKKLAAQQDYAQTPEGELDALNEKMKQPITQSQYEESNLKTETANATSLATSLSNISAPLDQLKLDNDFVLDKITTPSEPPSGVGFFKWTLPTGSCSGFSVDMSVGNGKLHTTKMVNEFCPFYETVAHPLLFWFLNIATFLYLFWLWDRSVSDMAR